MVDGVRGEKKTVMILFWCWCWCWWVQWKERKSKECCAVMECCYLSFWKNKNYTPPERKQKTGQKGFPFCFLLLFLFLIFNILTVKGESYVYRYNVAFLQFFSCFFFIFFNNLLSNVCCQDILFLSFYFRFQSSDNEYLFEWYSLFFKLYFKL